MILYLMRHGLAEDAAPGQPDHSRALTPAGEQQLRLQAAFLRHAALTAAHLFASPYVRAQQTAALVAPALGLAVETEQALRCGCTFDDVAALLERVAGAPGVLLVGHQPDLGRIVHTFSGSHVALWPGTLVVLDVQRRRPSGAALVGLYHPDVMARLGHAAGYDARDAPGDAARLR